jgi:hypothetical protein
MSSYAQLHLHGVWVYAWRNEVDPAFLFLFTKDDVHYFVGDSDEDDEYSLSESYQLRATAAILRDRLEVLGVGQTTLDKAFNALVKHGHDSLSRHWDMRVSIYGDLLPEVELAMKSNVELLERITLTEWAQLLVQALKSPQKSESNSSKDPASIEFLLELWGEDVDPRLLLGAALLTCDPEDEIVLDVSDLVDNLRLDHRFDPQQIAAQHFGYSLADGTPPVIITEGSTDAHFIQAAIRICYPHLQSYIKFLDFADGAEGSAAAGVRTLKSFAAAGIANRIVLLLDNDTAARDAVRALRGTKLPDHYSVLHYPDIELARSYPTLGPTGLSEMDVNGLAGSIEMYLGRDVLTGADGKLSPVQWRSYVPGVRAYQGEILDKAGAQKRFREKVKQATADPSEIANQDWNGLDAIIGSLIETLRGLSSLAS